MEIVLVRHGESIWNKENLFTGWTDVELSAKGVQEAKEAGTLLKEAGFDFDICYTSYLKRAIHTLDLILDKMDRSWLPVTKTWKLNERHYGALQGLNKAETATRYGEEQVKIWRRSYDTRPPALERDDLRCPVYHPAYKDVAVADLPLCESLKDTVARVVPYFEQEIRKEMQSGKRILISAHGNSLRALMKYFEGISDADITEVNIPTGVPLVYAFDRKLSVSGKRFLGDEKTLQAKMQTAAGTGTAGVLPQ